MSKVIDDIKAAEAARFPCPGVLSEQALRVGLEVEQVYQGYVQAETEAKHEAVEALRRVVAGEQSDELSALVCGILSKESA